MLMLMLLVVVVGFNSSGGLDLGWSHSGCWPRSLSGGRGGEVGLLLAGVEHHGGGGGGSGGCGCVLLNSVHGGGGARVLQVVLARVVVVVHVGRWKVLELMVVMWVMGHC